MQTVFLVSPSLTFMEAPLKYIYIRTISFPLDPVFGARKEHQPPHCFAKSSKEFMGQFQRLTLTTHKRAGQMQLKTPMKKTIL